MQAGDYKVDVVLGVTLTSDFLFEHILLIGHRPFQPLLAFNDTGFILKCDIFYDENIKKNRSGCLLCAPNIPWRHLAL